MTSLRWPRQAVGREKDLRRVTQAARAARLQARTQIVLISGEVGVGKTAFLDHFAKHYRRRKCFLLHGRHERGAPGTPFASLQGALNQALSSERIQNDVDRQQHRIVTEFLFAQSAYLEYFMDLPAVQTLPYEQYAAAVLAQHDHYVHHGESDLALRMSDCHLQIALVLEEIERFGESAERRGDVLRIVSVVGEIVGEASGDDTLDGSLLAVPAAVVGYLQPRKLPEYTHPEGRRRIFFNLIGELLGILSQQRPVALLIDDLQWADRGTLSLIEHLLDAPGTGPVLIVATHRHDDSTFLEPQSPALSDFLSAMTTRPNASLLELGPLSDQEIRSLVLRTLQGSPVPDVLVDDVVTRSEGSPLFARELLNYLIDIGTLEWSGRQWRAVGDAAAGQLPVSVRRVFEARLRQLLPPALHLLRGGAVVGREFPVDLARSTSGMSDLPGALTLQGLTERRLIEEVDGSRVRRNSSSISGDTYRFSHALLRETVYSQMSGVLRREMHGLVARAMEHGIGDRFGHNAGTIADHYLRSASPSYAVPFLLADGLRNLGLYDNARAAERLAAARTVLDETAACTTILSMYIDLVAGDLHRWDGQYEAAAALYERVVAASSDRTDDETTAALLHEVTWSAAASIPSDNEPTPRLEPSFDRIVADALLSLGRIEVKFTRWRQAGNLLQRAKAIALASGDALLEVRARRSLGWAYLDQGNLDDAVTELEACLTLIASEQLDLQATKYRLLGDLGRAAYLRGELDRSCQLTEEAVSLSTEAGDVPARAILLNNVGRAYHLMGRWLEARDAWERSRDLSRAVGDPYNAGFAISNLAKVQCDVGDYDSALANASEFIAICQGMRYEYGESIGLLTKCNALFMRGDEPGARIALGRALRLQRRMGVSYALPNGLLMLGRFHLAGNRPERAQIAFRRSAAGFASIGDIYSQSASIYFLAESQFAAGRDAESRATALALIADVRRRSLGLIEARTRALLSIIASRRGSVEVAGLHRRASLRLAAAMDTRLQDDLTQQLTD
jgi:predicted ATPase